MKARSLAQGRKWRSSQRKVVFPDHPDPQVLGKKAIAASKGFPGSQVNGAAKGNQEGQVTREVLGHAEMSGLKVYPGVWDLQASRATSGRLDLAARQGLQAPWEPLA
jgi:hypothetical protein